MIPNQWYPIFESHSLGREPVGIKRGNQNLVLFRTSDGQPCCLVDRCPHRGAALSKGRLLGGEIQCRYHGLRFNGQGQCVAMPCEGPQATIPSKLNADALTVQEDYGLIWMWWGADPTALGLDRLPPIPWFEGFTDMSQSSPISGIVPGNILRWMDSTMDVAHSEFSHGMPVWHFGTLAGTTEVNVHEHLNRFDFEATMVPEPGTNQHGIDVRYSFIPPSLILTIDNTNAAYAFITADCPVDAHHTWRHGRQYFRPKWRIPGLGKLGAWLMMRAFWYLVFNREDLPIVTSQLSPPGTDQLLRPDMGIANCRKIYRKLLQEALAQEDLLPPMVRHNLHEMLAFISVPGDRTMNGRSESELNVLNSQGSETIR